MYTKGSIHSFHDRNIEVLLEASDISKRIAELSRQIENDYKGKELVVIGVLKGAFVFMSDLIRSLHLPLTCDFLRAASYEGERSTGTVRLEFDLTQAIAGKDVLLVEDIVDTGTTLKCLLNHLTNKNVNSLKVASLLFKEKGTQSRKHVNYLAFEVPDRFVIGYGLDCDGLYRSLPFVGAFT